MEGCFMFQWEGGFLYQMRGGGGSFSDGARGGSIFQFWLGLEKNCKLGEGHPPPCSPPPNYGKPRDIGKYFLIHPHFHKNSIIKWI